MGQLPTIDDGKPILPPWIYPPANFENIDFAAYIALPAIAAPDAVVVGYIVPAGRNAIIIKIANNFVGGGWVEGSGDIVWRITKDGAAIQGYNNIVNSLGNPSSPTQIAGFRAFEGEVVDIVVANVAVAVAGQRVGGRLVGWAYPREIEDSQIWI